VTSVACDRPPWLLAVHRRQGRRCRGRLCRPTSHPRGHAPGAWYRSNRRRTVRCPRRPVTL